MKEQANGQYLERADKTPSSHTPSVIKPQQPPKARATLHGNALGEKLNTPHSGLFLSANAPTDRNAGPAGHKRQTYLNSQLLMRSIVGLRIANPTYAT